MAFKIMIDPIKQAIKNTENMGKQQMSLIQHNIENIKELSDTICDSEHLGHGWSTMVSEQGKRKNEDFIESSLVALDIDESENLDIDEFVKISNAIGLPANILYETYSSVNGNRYRVVYRMQTTTSHEIAKLHNLLLFEIFKKFDKTEESNKGIDRGSLQQSKLYQPTDKGVIYNHEDILYLDKLLSIALAHSDNRLRLLQKISNNTRIDIHNNWINYIQDGLSVDDSYDYVVNKYEISMGNYVNIGVLKNKKIIELNRTSMEFEKSASIEVLSSRCEKIRDMLSGKYGKPDYNDFLNTAINMCYIKGGQKAMSQIIELNYDSNISILDKQRNLIQIADRVKNNTLHNACCNIDNCKYYSSCNNKKPCSILSVSVQSKGQITKKERNEVSLDEGREQLKKNIIKVINEHDTDNIVLLKSDCGLGKTHAIIELMNTYDNIGLFLPTHVKCKEVYDILSKTNDDICYVKPFPRENLVPIEYKNDYIKIKTLNELGFSSDVIDGLKDLQRMLNLDLNNKKTSKKIQDEGRMVQYNRFATSISDYLGSRIDSKYATKIIATHKYLTTIGAKAFSKIDKIIIDEDVINALIDTRTCDIKSIFKIIDDFKKQGGMEKYISILNNMLISDNESISVVNNKIDITKSEAFKISETIENTKIKVDDILFCKSYIRVRDKILYASIANIDRYPHQAIINLTATPSPEKILKEAFNANIKVYETESVHLKGQIIQFNNISAYKKQLNDEKYFDKLVDILNELDIKNVITYKSFKERFENKDFDCDIYFGNEEGLNTYTGQDIAVVGTYLQNPTATQLIASLTYDVGNYKIVERMTRQRIEVDGVEQTLQTYKDDLLKEIQLHALYSKIIQSAGRSRAISTDATVYVFATLVHPQADICNLDVDTDVNDILKYLDNIYKSKESSTSNIEYMEMELTKEELNSINK